MNLLVTFLVVVTVGIVRSLVGRSAHRQDDIAVRQPADLLSGVLPDDLAVMEAGGALDRAEVDASGLTLVAQVEDQGLPVRSSGDDCPIASKAVPLRPRSRPCS